MKRAICFASKFALRVSGSPRRAKAPAQAVLALTLTLFSFAFSPAQVQPELAEPKLLSIFPLGGRRGTTVHVEVRGNALLNANVVWLDSDSLRGRLLTVEMLKEDPNPKLIKANEKPPIVYQAAVELEIAPSASLGLHSLRLVTPLGISDAVPFRVVDEPVILEATSPHGTIAQAQPMAFPAVINGRIAKPGELDYYSFQAKQGEELSFQVIQSQNCDPRLALFREGGSWLNPDRPTRLLMRQELSSDLMQEHADGTYRFIQNGQYFLEVSSIFGRGSPGSTYLVRVDFPRRAPFNDAQREDSTVRSSNEWLERSFGRSLQNRWIELVEGRSVKQSGDSTAPDKNNLSGANTGSSHGAGKEQQSRQEAGTHARLSSTAEREPNDHFAEAQDVTIPAIIEGAIEHPGDVDSFKFEVSTGQKVAIEIETPDTMPPYFNPRVGVVDGQNHEIFSNVERRLSMFNNNADPQVYLKTISSKAVFAFEHAGDYVLQIRDITSRYGGPSYRYKILVRPEIPHLGEVTVLEGDHVNLIRGESKKLTVIAAYEEGFNGDVLFFFTGLPEGVQALPAAQYDEGRPPLEVTQKPEIIAPSEQKSVIVLVAGAEAPLTLKPAIVLLHCRPILKGKLGPELLVREIPMTVVESAPRNKEEKLQSTK
jgi:hypothetical protein